MAALILPTDPPPASMTVTLISAKNDLTPAFGGDEQQLARKGSRYVLTYQLPLMTYTQSMDWDDLMAEGETVLMRVFQPGFEVGAPGIALVDGAGQSGTTLLLKGLTPHYPLSKGQFLSIVTGGQRFLYRTAAASIANSSGQMIVRLRTMLRRPHSNNDVVEIAEPMIEGFLRDVSELSVGVDHMVGLQFTIRERE